MKLRFLSGVILCCAMIAVNTFPHATFATESATELNAVELAEPQEPVAEEIVPELTISFTSPLREQDTEKRLEVIAQQSQYKRELNSSESNAGCASASSFPGIPAADAPRITREVRVDATTSSPNLIGPYGAPNAAVWHSLGLYAAPGEVVTVRVSDEVAAAKQLRIQVGCHTDNLERLNEWKRYPQITYSLTIDKPTTTIRSPFGGLVYVVVSQQCKIGEVNITLENVIASPLFVRGQTTIDDWHAQIESCQVPWGELATDKVIISLPTSVLQKVDDPEKVMAFWDRVLDTCVDLLGITHERTRAERMVPDVQISAGYMHSGYPIMTHMDVINDFIDLEKLRKNGWGFFHEIGHNHQNRDWTFSGTTEVTVNLFSLYVFEKVFQIQSAETRTELTRKWQQRAIERYLAAEKPFEMWRKDAFLALTMYVQLIEKYGWDAFTQTFAGYRQLPDEERPRSDEARRDQWMVRFSQTVGENLGPFFEAWGIPTTEKARASINDLPIPTGLELQRVLTAPESNSPL